MNRHDDDQMARQLRESLRREALRVTPRDRLAEIQARTAHPVRQLRPSRPAWLVPLTAAAAAAVIGGLVWGAGALSGPTAAPATTPTATSTDVPTASATTTTAAPTTTTPQVPSTTTTRSLPPPSTEVRSLPVYYAAPEAPDRPVKLFREFVPTQLPTGASTEFRVQRALQLSMTFQGDTATPSVEYWAGVQVISVEVTSSLITVELSGPGGRLPAAEEARLAAQQLSWTAQAVVGRGNVAVRFISALAGDAQPLLGQLEWSARYTRPPADQQYLYLAGVWLDDPARDAVLPRSADVVVTGSACVFEGALRWTLGGTLTAGTELEVRDGTLQTSGCPTRGSYRFSLGRLEPGVYRVSVLAMDGAGELAAFQARTFTVQ